MLFSSPVRGFLPFLADRLDTEKDPNPTKATLFPLERELEVAPINASNALLESAFESPDPDAIASINSALFIVKNLRVNKIFIEFEIKLYLKTNMGKEKR